MNYALVENNIVGNIIFLNPTNAHDFPAAVPINDLPVGIGDTYEDGKFYRDGVEILPIEIPVDIPTEDSIEIQLQDAIDALTTLGYEEATDGVHT